MGYILYAFLGRREAIQPIGKRYQHAHLCELQDGMGIIPMTEALFDEINEYQQTPGIGTFVLLTKNVEEKILPLIAEKQVAYIEAEYYGGHGGQSGLLWANQKRLYQQMSAKGVINQILRQMGVKAKDALDEFDTVGLGKYRETEDWINE